MYVFSSLLNAEDFIQYSRSNLVGKSYISASIGKMKHMDAILFIFLMNIGS